MKLLQTVAVFLLATASAFAQTVPGQYPQASQKVLSITDIQEMDEPSLKIMRNEIFARYGYIFKGEDLKAHFGAQAWYKATSADVTAQLTAIEKQNTTLIKNQETRIRTTAEFEDFYQLFRTAVQKNQMDKIVALAHLDMMGGDAQVRESFNNRWNKIEDWLPKQETINSEGGSATFTYEERLEGTQVEYIVFTKIGSCWYITGFDSAG